MPCCPCCMSGVPCCVQVERRRTNAGGRTAIQHPHRCALAHIARACVLFAGVCVRQCVCACSPRRSDRLGSAQARRDSGCGGSKPLPRNPKPYPCTDDLELKVVGSTHVVQELKIANRYQIDRCEDVDAAQDLELRLVQPCTRSRTRTHAHTHSLTRSTHAHTRVHTCTHACPYSCQRAHAHTNARARACARAHTHTTGAAAAVRAGRH
jgi:hypothetical protein